MQAGNFSSPRAEQVARALLIAFLFSIPAVLCMRGAAGCVADPDLGWHLQTGRWILQHHTVPRVDPFSRVEAGSPWQAYSWLFELVIARLYRWMNLLGIVAFTAAMMVLITAAIYRMLGRLQADFTVRAALAASLVFCLARLGTPRPWLFTILFFVLEIDILMHARREGKSRELLCLPLLFALWANLHIQFIDGLLVLGLAACEPILARWWKSATGTPPARHLWMTLGACVAATFLNPYGPGIYKIAWKLGSQPGVLDTVSEMQALPFRSLGDFVLLFLALAAAGVLFRYRQLPPFETLLLVLAAVLSFRSRRDLWVMAISAGAMVAAGLPARPEKRTRGALPVWASAITAAFTAVAFIAGLLVLHINNPRLHKLLAEKMPVQAVEFIRERHYSGALFNNYDWGGFLIWKLQEPVSMDGRAGLYGDQRIDRSRATWGGGPQWASDPDLQSAGIVLAPDGAALTQLLRTDARFHLAYQDKVATVFVTHAGGSRSETLAALHHGQDEPPAGVKPQ